MRSAKPGLKGGAAAWAGAAVCALKRGGPNRSAATKTKTRTTTSACLSIDYPHVNRGAMTPRSSSSAKLVTTLRKATSGLPHRGGRRNIAPMHFARQVLPAAIMLAWLAGAAHAGPAGCELNKVAPARVATKAAPLLRRRRRRAHSRLSLRRERLPASSLRRARGRGPPRFNRRGLCVRVLQVAGGSETRGWLPRASLELVARAP